MEVWKSVEIKTLISEIEASWRGRGYNPQW